MDFIYLITIQFNIVLKVLRLLFFFIDSLVYSLIPLMYDLIKKIVDVKLIADETEVIGQVADSIYSLLAIYMFFRLAFSLLNMLVNPDAISDKEKGAGKIMTNIVICLILIVGMPMIFTMAESLQSNIINNDVIENIFLGQDVSCDNSSSTFVSDSGTTHGGGGGTYDSTSDGTDNSTPTSQQCKALDFGDYIATTVLNMFVRIPYDEVRDKMNSANPKMLEAYDAVFNENSGTFHSLWIFNKYINYDTTFDSDTGGIAEGEHVFWFAYLPIVSTIVGGFLVWTFVNLAIEIAQRAVKLFVLRVISPIAIVSYIDPSSASKGVFKKWTDEYIKTYISLFIRLAVLALITLIVSKIDITELSAGDNVFVFLFIILGLVSFIKTAPKMFENLFGFKSSGDSWGNAIVKKGLGFGGALTAGAIGGVTGGVIGALSGGISSKMHGMSWKDSLTKGVGYGAKSGLVSGATKGFKTERGAKGPIGYAKGLAMGIPAGFGGHKAAAGRLDYKTGKDYRTEKHKYADARDAFSKYSANLPKSDEESITASTNNWKTNFGSKAPFKRELTVGENKMFNKAVRNETAYKKMFSSNYAEALTKMEKAKAENIAFKNQLEEASVKASSTGDDSDYKALIGHRDGFNKAYEDEKARFENIAASPKYASDNSLYKDLQLGKSIDGGADNEYKGGTGSSNGSGPSSPSGGGPSSPSNSNSSGTGVDWGNYT